MIEQLTGMVISGNGDDAAQLLRNYYAKAKEEGITEGRRRERAERDKRILIAITEAQLTDCVTKVTEKSVEKLLSI